MLQQSLFGKILFNKVFKKLTTARFVKKIT